LEKDVKRRRFSVTREAFARLAEMALDDFGQVLFVLDKIELYLGDGGPVSAEVIDSCAHGLVSAQVFAWAEAVGAQNWSQAWRLLQSLWAQQESPLPLLALLTRHYRILLKALENQALWRRRGDMARVLGVPPFAVERYLQQARRYGAAQLRSFWTVLMATDRDLKSSPVASERCLEALQMTLKRAAAAPQALKTLS
jgi:DNA polymerase-3 subunit delta